MFNHITGPFMLRLQVSIIGGLIIAGAPVIVKALFTAFGIDSSTVDVGSFQ